MKGLSIFITGGTGTLGSHLIEQFSINFPELEKMTIYSRGEYKQHCLRQKLSKQNFPKLEFKIGDIRDYDRLAHCSKGADIIIHATAMKHIPICEENPEECIKSNVDGTKNIIKVAQENEIKKVLLFSTDKAVDPISIYGNSKQAAEKLVLNANCENISLSVVRFGNILGSRGSVIPYWQKQKEQGVIPVTHPEMTRFGGTVSESVDLVLYALGKMKGGEIFIKKLPAFSILDLANAICASCEKKIIGLRGHEKIHEHFLSEIETGVALENQDYVIVPNEKLTENEGLDYYNGLPLRSFDSLNSEKSGFRLDSMGLKEKVEIEENPEFKIRVN